MRLDRQETIEEHRVLQLPVHKVSVPVGGCEEQNFVGIERLPLHQKSHIRHLLVVQEVGIWGTRGQKNNMFF